MDVFKKEWLHESEYPSNFIPADCEVFIGVDYASPDKDCTVRGFYKDGEFHIQEVEYDG